MPAAHAPVTALLLAAVLAAACGGPRDGPADPARETLAHQVPETGLVSYEFTDTSTYTTSTGAMGAMDVVAAQQGLAELTYAQLDTGLEVVVRFEEYDASYENPAQGGRRATTADIGGAFRLRLGPRGEVEIVDTASVSSGGLGVTGPEALVRHFFAPLPATPAGADTQWVDTVRVVEEGRDMSTRSVSYRTARLAGDTVVAGAPAVVILLETTTQVESRGRSGGVDVRRRMSGEARGHVLWDARRHLMVARYEEGRLEGSLDLPQTGAGPFPVTSRYVRAVRLVD